MAKLSIVVIIYKIEQYLRQCLDSILAQTYKEFELILVDDGSPDRCPSICDEYAKQDNRIKVIHQANQGSVAARRNGLMAATGEYVSFIDGDDWLDSDMYEEMMNLAEMYNADIVVVGYKEGTESVFEEKGNAIKTGCYRGESLVDLHTKALYTGVFYEPGIVPAFWNKIMRRELLFNNCAPISTKIKMGEDAAVTYPAIAKANTIVINNEIHPYHYRIVEGSMSRAYDEKFFERALDLFESLKNNLNENQIMGKQLKFYTLFIIKIGILQLCSRNSKLSILQQRKELHKFYKEYLDLKIDITYDEKIFDNCTWMKLFITGKIRRAITSLYKGKIINRIESIHMIK